MTELRSGLALPHSYPFLLLDRIVEIRPGVSAVAVKNLTRSDPLFDAVGVLPAVLLAEMIAQCVGVAVLAEQPGRSAILARIDRFRVGRQPVEAGDQLRVTARVLRLFGSTVKARGVVCVGQRVRAAAELVLQLVAGNPPSSTGGLSTNATGPSIRPLRGRGLLGTNGEKC